MCYNIQYSIYSTNGVFRTNGSSTSLRMSALPAAGGASSRPMPLGNRVPTRSEHETIYGIKSVIVVVTSHTVVFSQRLPAASLRLLEHIKTRRHGQA